MGKYYDAVVFIGRFQPFHLAHLAVIEQAFAQTDHLILLIGSANRPPTLKNPFTFYERAEGIQAAVNAQLIARKSAKKLTCLPINDTLYNDNLWLQTIQRAVLGHCKTSDNIAIIGHNKDESSYYLQLFPRWQVLEIDNIKSLSATPIREAFFEDKDLGEGIFVDNLPKATLNLLASFKATATYQQLRQEYQYIQEFEAHYKNLPYSLIFQTVDLLVVQSGHVLLIERQGVYGRGLMAMAGGFVDSGETLQQAAIRELIEETGLDVGAMIPKRIKTFDKPDRSVRGRTISTVFYYELTGDALPALSAGDDAKNAFWLPLGKLSSVDLFEDHYDIISCMLGIV